MKPDPQLLKFLKPYHKEIQILALELRDFILTRVPAANELLYDSYNAIAIAFSLSDKLGDAFCHLAVYPEYVNLGFNRGAELPSGKPLLKGKGKLIRHIRVKNIISFPKDEVGQLLLEAVNNSEERNPKLHRANNITESIVMAVSAKKRRPKI